MPNDDFFANTSIAPVRGTAITPYPAGQINSAMLYAAADKPTQQRLTKEFLSNQCRALLTIDALQNTMLISIVEMHCNQQAPLSEQRHKMIVDAFVASTANRIVRW
ncbi:MAG: hypothetical protein ACK5MN_10560 [Lachnospiraceae bacterium]